MNPYEALPPRSFWRSGVAGHAPDDLGPLWTAKHDLAPDEPILTAGSCFAREIGRALLERGLHWFDAEPAPPGLSTAERQARQYGMFSFRTGNVYTAAMLAQWLAWATGSATPPEEAWTEQGRWFDPFRPAVEPAGYDSPEAMRTARDTTLAAIRRGLDIAGWLVFTLGLTEAWRNRADGTVYPVCPGTLRGTFDDRRHAFHNSTVAEVHRDLSSAIATARAVNPGLRVLLTVSPVPLTATATGAHVLTATTYSKSVLRVVAEQLAAEHDHVDYFPSYELITGVPFRGQFYESNLRTVTPAGVAFVMRHFFNGLSHRPTPPAPTGSGGVHGPGEGESCDDAILDYYNAG
jgi:hypothetical protein